MMEKVIYNQWITQAFEDQYFLKWLLLRLGDAPSGFMPMNNEVQWILQQIDQQRVVELTVFDPSWCSGLDWFLSHVVLAYDYKIIGHNTYLYVYGPNLGNSVGGQIIPLTKDIEGNYEIAGEVANIETFAINRFGSREAPLWGQTWSNVLNYLHELLSHVIEYVMQKATEYIEVFIKWLKDNLKDLWSTLMKVKDQFSDLWNQFVNWVSENAKDVWSRIVHFKLWSAVELDIYNPEGKHVGLTPTGDLDLDFDAIFLISNEMTYCAMINPDPGDYFVRLLGIEEGKYHLTFASIQDGVIVHEYTVPGISYVGLTRDFTVSVSPLGESILDDDPPATLLDIGKPKIIDGLNTYVTSSTPFTLTAIDNPGGSGVASTVYKIYNGTYDSGWITYVDQFIIPAWLDDGTYNIAYGSTDYARNVEPTNTATAILDNTPPLLTIETPAENDALQDGVTFKVSAWDLSAVASVTFSIRCPQGNIISPEFQSMPTTLGADGKWRLYFDTRQLADGFYLFVANGTDVLGNWGTTTALFSIRNWATIELLPASETNKAGRTMPVKFSIRVKASVDPAQPFIHNEELTIKIYRKGYPGTIFQTSTYGTTSTDYRIDSVGEKYITNFKTLSTPATYVVEIYRKGMLIGTFEFKTVK